MEKSESGLLFTTDQTKAINHRKGHLRIIACPGSGKTEVVSERVVTLIEKGTEPKTIVAFTFTEKAAEELKIRIRTKLDERCPQKSDFGDMFIGTIHSFCFFMLKEIDPAYRSFEVLDDAKRVAFLSMGKNYYKNVGLIRLQRAHGIKHYKAISEFIESSDIVMTEDIDPEKLSNQRFAECYLAYRKILEDEKYFDFSSIMHKFVEIVKNDKSKLLELGQRVKHVVVDEYQDINKIQEMLIEILSTGADSVCVVGDDDQNIFHWRGSDVSIIRKFRERYKNYNVTDVKLEKNFRSTDAIVYTAKKFIENNLERLPKNMISNDRLERKFENGDLFYNHFQDDDEEFGFVLNKINELRGTDFIDKRNRNYSLSYQDFAILVRTNRDAARVIDFLSRNHIECISHSGTSIFERPITVFAMDCIGYVFSTNGYNRDDIPSLQDLKLRYELIFNNHRYPSADPRSFSSKLATVKKEVDKLLAKGKKDYFGDLGLQGFYYKILNAMGAEDFDLGEVYHYNLAALSAAISDYESVWVRLRASEVSGLFFFVYAFARSHYTDSQRNDPSLIDAVHVLTIHKAKGLEFPVIFIPNFEKKKRRRPEEESFVDTSLYDHRKYSGTEEDERRVYYTAITRSEKYLFITGSKEQDHLKSSYEPHQFTENIDLKYFSDNPTSVRKKSGFGPKIRHIGTFPTSFSHLSCYDRCPQDFRLRHVYQYNAGVPVTFGYGTNVHNMLNIVHSDYIRNKRIPSNDEIEKILDRIFKLRYATPAISEPMKKICSKDSQKLCETPQKRFHIYSGNRKKVRVCIV